MKAPLAHPRSGRLGPARPIFFAGHGRTDPTKGPKKPRLTGPTPRLFLSGRLSRRKRSEAPPWPFCAVFSRRRYNARWASVMIWTTGNGIAQSGRGMMKGRTRREDNGYGPDARSMTTEDEGGRQHHGPPRGPASYGRTHRCVQRSSSPMEASRAHKVCSATAGAPHGGRARRAVSGFTGKPLSWTQVSK